MPNKLRSLKVARAESMAVARAYIRAAVALDDAAEAADTTVGRDAITEEAGRIRALASNARHHANLLGRRIDGMTKHGV